MVVPGVSTLLLEEEARRLAKKAGVPFVVWVTFATVLTASIWRLNRHR